MIRVAPIEGELFGSSVLRMAAINLIPVELLLSSHHPVFRDVGRVRDVGEGIVQFSALFENPRDLQRRIERQGTLLTYYLGDSVGSFQGRSGRNDLRDAIRQGSYLRLCEECFHEDQKLHSVAIWHLEHQLPMTLVCLRHQIPLSTVTYTGRLTLPPNGHHHRYVFDADTFEKFRTIAESEKHLFELRLQKGEYYNYVNNLSFAFKRDTSWYAEDNLFSEINRFTKSINGIGIFSTLCQENWLSRHCRTLINGNPTELDSMFVSLIDSLLIDKRKRKN